MFGWIQKKEEHTSIFPDNETAFVHALPMRLRSQKWVT
jgi:hypothetical protein